MIIYLIMATQFIGRFMKRKFPINRKMLNSIELHIDLESLIKESIIQCAWNFCKWQYSLTTSSENVDIYVAIILRRKIVAAVLSSLLFALIFSLPGGFEEDRYLNLYYLNLMIVITYGVIASFFSDWLSRKISKRTYTREITSFLIHCCCGAVLLVSGLGSAILFFIIDRLLGKVKIGWLSVIIALLIVVLVFIIMINR